MNARTRYRDGRELLARQQAICCSVFDSVDACAPTLCEGWTAFDLAAHLDALCRDPLSWPGIGSPLFAPLTAHRAGRLQRRLGYSGLVDRLRRRSPVIPLFALDPLAGWLHHLGEWFVHTEDIRRANELPRGSSEPDLDEALWHRVQPAARILYRRQGRGLLLRHTDGRTAEVVIGPNPLVVAGDPADLIVYVYRGEAASLSIS